MAVGSSTFRSSPSPSTQGMAISYEMVGPTAEVVDLVLMLALTPLAVSLLLDFPEGPSGTFLRSFALSGAACAMIMPLLHLQGVYAAAQLGELWYQLKAIVAIYALYIALITFVGSQLRVPEEISRFATEDYACAFVFLILHRIFWANHLKGGLKGLGVHLTAIVLITEDGGVDPKLRLRLEAHGYDIRLRLSVDDICPSNRRHYGNLTMFRGAEIDEIVLAVPMHRIGARLLKVFDEAPFPVRFLPHDRLSQFIACSGEAKNSAALFEIRSGPLSDKGRRAKRMLDFVGATSGLVLLSPVMILCAIAIAFESSGPVLFRQTRLGFNGRPFKIYKFRSMFVMEEGRAVVAAKRDDARVTRVGRIIRRLSIDELPQLINVLHGEMSLVGPRPHALAHDEYYDRLLVDYTFRQHVKPGLTGWAQINGLRGEIVNVTEMEQRLGHDLWYIRNWSLLLDLKIMLRTALSIFLTEKAY